MVLSASFDALLIYIGFTLAFFSMLTVVGLMRIRIGARKNQNGYSTWGYPVTPLLFIIGNLWIIIYSIKSRPASALIGLGTILMGILAYFYFERRCHPKHNRAVAEELL
jgi:APA family basic amino acid/polyamine antiporter